MKERYIVLLDGFTSDNYDQKYVYYIDDLSVEDTINEIFSNNRFIVDN